MRSLLVAVLLALSPGASPAAAPPLTRAAFHDAMRKLWEDHITWTRVYIISAVAGQPDADQAAQRLLKNQTDIGDAIKPFYGDAAGERLTGLLRGHILTAAKLIVAAKGHDSVATRAASSAWYANADSIAQFLSAANPHQWTQATLTAGMHMHLDLTFKEAAARLQGDWASDIAAYDQIHDHILGLADLLSSGIIAQFPARFH